MKRPQLVIDDADAYAVKAVAAGTATPAQQRRAMNFILNASGIRSEPRVFEHPGELEFDVGKRFIGWQLARLIELTGITSNVKEPNV